MKLNLGYIVIGIFVVILAIRCFMKKSIYEGLDDASLIRAAESRQEDYLKTQSDVFIPAALELSIKEEEAKILNCNIIIEGSNGPVSDKAEDILLLRNIPVIPDILCNSGGVVVSYYEWVQNKSNEYWTKEKVFEKLDDKMIQCYHKIKSQCNNDSDWRLQCYKYSIEKLYKVYSVRKSYLFD